MGFYTIPTIYRNVSEDLRGMGHAEWAAQEDPIHYGLSIPAQVTLQQ